MTPPSEPVQIDLEVTAAKTLTNLCKYPSTSPSAHQPVHQASFSDMMPALKLPAAPLLEVLVVPNVVPAAEQDDMVHIPSTRPPLPAVQSEVKRHIKLNFPQKLLEILETPEHSNILKWLPGGKAFVIIDKKRFASDILPTYLKPSQFTSFTRKLCRWKFVRVPRGPFMGAYYHKLFKRDHPALCELMSCDNNAPSLDLLAYARHQAMESIRAAASPRSNAIGLCSIPQQNAFQSLEEANRVSMIKKELLTIHLKRAHLYEQQKRILKCAEDTRETAVYTSRHQPLPPSQVPALQQQVVLRIRHPEVYMNDNNSAPQQVQTHHPQFHMNGYIASNSSMILQDAFRALKGGNTIAYNANMSELAKLRQTGMLDRAAATRTNHMRTRLRQTQVPQEPNDGNQGAARNSIYRASAA